MSHHGFLPFAAAAIFLTGAGSVSAQSSGLDAFRTPPAPPPITYYDASTLKGSTGLRHDPLPGIRKRIAQGQFGEARRSLSRISIASAEVHYLTGVVHANLGDYESAHRAFLSGVGADPSHVGARLGSALIDIRAGDLVSAQEALNAIETQRMACKGGCRNARDLERGAAVLRHFLTVRTGD